jgi:hypothetical protein
MFRIDVSRGKVLTCLMWEDDLGTPSDTETRSGWSDLCRGREGKREGEMEQSSRACRFLAVENGREVHGLSLQVDHLAMTALRRSGSRAGTAVSLACFLVRDGGCDGGKILAGSSPQRCEWFSTKLDHLRRRTSPPTPMPLEPGSGQLNDQRHADSDAAEQRGRSPLGRSDQTSGRKSKRKNRLVLPACCSSRTTT